MQEAHTQKHLNNPDEIFMLNMYSFRIYLQGQQLPNKFIFKEDI